MTERENLSEAPKKISRRQFNTLIVHAGVTALASYYGINEAINPPRKDPLYKFEEIDKATKHELLRYSPTVVFHNAMNNMNRFEIALSSLPDYIDVDLISKDGKIYASHNPYNGIPVLQPLLDKIPNVVGPFKPNFEAIAKRAAETNQALYLDLKNLGMKDFERVRKIIKEREIEGNSIFSSKHWGLIDYAREIYGPKKVVYSVENSGRLEKYSLRDVQDGNVSLAKHLATRENIDALKTGRNTVFIYPVNSSHDALEVLHNGANGMVTENLSLISVYGGKL